jgi:hypothetical protein
MKSNFLLIVLCLTVLFHLKCTENPFFDDDKIPSGGAEIRGSVKLNDEQSSDGVFVWLQGFNIGSFTDDHGNFKIELPPVSSQINAGVSGIFNLYFYVANYKVDTSKVFIRSGEVVFSKADINKKGELSSVKELCKLLHITTSVEPSIVRKDYKGEINVTVILQAVVELVDVLLLLKIVETGERVDLMAGGFLRRIDSDQWCTEALDVTSLKSVSEPIGFKARSWKMVFNKKIANLSIGQYEIIPYIVVNQNSIPQELFDSLGSNVQSLSFEYLNLPFKREGGYLEVIE